MTNNNPYQVYQQTQVKTLSQGRLILMLYEGAVKFLKQAIDSIEENKTGEATNFIIKVEDIFYELESTLNMSAGPVAQQLKSTYQTINAYLIQANIKLDKDILIRVLYMVRELQSAWVEIIEGTKDSRNQRGITASA